MREECKSDRLPIFLTRSSALFHLFFLDIPPILIVGYFTPALQGHICEISYK